MDSGQRIAGMTLASMDSEKTLIINKLNFDFMWQLCDYRHNLLKETIEAFFDKEVKLFVPDAWIDYSKTMVGYDISMTRHFYLYELLRKLEDIEGDIKSLEGEIVKLLGVVTKWKKSDAVWPI